MSDQPKGDAGRFSPSWLAIGIGVGAAIGAATKNPAVGIGVGTAIGIALAFAMPRKK